MASTYLPTLNWPIYSGWTAYTPVIPKVYWDVYSQEQRIKWLFCNTDKLQHYMDYIAELTNEWVLEYSEGVQEELDNFSALIESGYKEALNAWIERDLPDVIAKAIKMVFFGLTMDGYFCAYIPKSWQGIQFDTIMDYSSDNYGHLVLKY